VPNDHRRRNSRCGSAANEEVHVATSQGDAPCNAFAYNVLGVPIAAGVLYPFFRMLLCPMIAAAAMSLSSVSVIANALRLRRMKL
jgi:hypothetical protein